MAHSNGRPLSTRATSGAVTVIEVSVARSYARRARICFYLVALSGLAVGVIAALFAPAAHRALAVGVGLAAGLIVGGLVSAVVTVWPVLRSVWHWSLETTLGVAVVVGLN